MRIATNVCEIIKNVRIILQLPPPSPQSLEPKVGINRQRLSQIIISIPQAKKAKFAHCSKTPACISHLVCVKSCRCFVLGQASQECIFCTPVIFVYFMSSLSVQCRKWFFNGAQANSIFCHNVTCLFPFFAHSDIFRFDQNWGRYGIFVTHARVLCALWGAHRLIRRRWVHTQILMPLGHPFLGDFK